MRRDRLNTLLDIAELKWLAAQAELRKASHKVDQKRAELAAHDAYVRNQKGAQARDQFDARETWLIWAEKERTEHMGSMARAWAARATAVETASHSFGQRAALQKLRDRC